MDLSLGAGKLQRAWKNLMVHWDDTKSRWNDPVGAAFEENYLLPLEEDVNAVRKEMDRLAAVLSQAYHECR